MKHAHFIGICGVGMSATAILMKEAGWTVTGSDAESYGPTLDILSAAGIVPLMGYRPENIPGDTDLFVIGRNAKLAADENTEVRAAHGSGKPIRTFPEELGELTQGRKNLVVAGSYGKSTTTALIAHILREAGIDAGYFIGASPLSLPGPASLGTDSLFVLEGDEYPSGHDDSRAKFLHLHPRDVVLTAVVHDHVNVFPTFADYQKPFRELLKSVPGDGLVTVSADEPGALALAKESGKKLVTYGIEHGDFQAADITYGERTAFSLVTSQGTIALETGLLGRHNIENIAGASAYLLSRELLSPAALADAIKTFAGIRRRLDNIALGSRIPVYEGFGSSYEKARSAGEAMKTHFPGQRIVIVFEPHTFGWRNKANLAWYDDVFKEASLIFIAPPATQGLATHEQLSHGEIMGRVEATGLDTRTYDPAHPEAVAGALAENDVVLVLTSGDLEGSLTALAGSIERSFPR